MAKILEAFVMGFFISLPIGKYYQKLPMKTIIFEGVAGGIFLAVVVTFF